MQIFDVASRHMEWLAQRQEVTASNIANANTPAYRAQDVAPFESYLQDQSVELSASNPGHISAASMNLRSFEGENAGAWDVSYSGNDVALERELTKAGDTSRMMGLDTNLMRSFHRMILSSLKA